MFSARWGLLKWAADRWAFNGTASVIPPPPPPPPPVVIMSATSGLAFGDEEIERKPVVVAKPPKPVKAKKKKRKKPKRVKIKASSLQLSPTPAPVSVTETTLQEPAPVSFNTAEYLRLIAEVEQAERLRETIAEEDELLLLGCFYRP